MVQLLVGRTLPLVSGPWDKRGRVAPARPERDDLSHCGVAVLPLSKARGELERASSTYECTDSDGGTPMYCLSLISRATSIRLRESLSAVAAESE